MEKFLWCGKLSGIILSQFANCIETHHRTDLKRNTFLWGREQEEAFQEVEHRMSTPTVLHLPRAIGRLVLFSDTSKVGTGSSLWQYQDGKLCLIGYMSNITRSLLST